MRKDKKLCIVFLLCLFCLAAAAGCGSGEADSAGDEAAEETEKTTGTGNIGEFTVEDIEGNTYTQEMFAEHDLTMVNVFTTWCSPCINEIPELEQLSHDMAGQGVAVAGIVLDARGESGNVDEDAVEQAGLLAEKLGVTYPFLIPDEGYLNGRLAGISAVPETFFVDREGNYVGETYLGSRTLEEWKDIVEKELKGTDH